MRVFNTLSGTKESAQWKAGDAVRLFVCGPTVYDEAHLGHARTYIVFDAFAKYLRSLGVRLTYLQNITDIDDKIITRAMETGVSVKTLAAKYARHYHASMRALSIDAVDTHARATEHIPAIIRQVQTLIAREHAYTIPDDGIYFDITTFPNYGKLSHRTASQAEDAVTRIDESIQKRNRGDFCLWKFSQHSASNTEPSWRAPFGAGRPGWHIEDTAITEAFFGAQYEIHGGALDLKFPHHEAEIAQMESASGKSPMVALWMHTGFLTVRGEKMSKSLKNFVTIPDFLTHHTPEALRLLVLSHHYRSPVNYSPELADEHETSWHTVSSFAEKLQFVSRRSTAPNTEIQPLVHAAEIAFAEALADDFNTPQALGALFSLIRDIQSRLWTLSKNDAHGIYVFLETKLTSLGFPRFSRYRIPLMVRFLARQREISRRNKQFMRSDALRDKILRVGYVIEDTPLGPFMERAATSTTNHP